MIEPMLSILEVRKALGVSRTTLFKIRQDPDFPKPFKIGGQIKYKASEIEGYIEKKKVG